MKEEYTKDEVFGVIQRVFEDYVKLFEAHRMSSLEFALIENILIKLENGFKELD